jgi:hypothetical protein
MAISVRRVVRTTVAIALGVSAAVVWYVCGAGEPSPAPAAVLPDLPVVVRPPAEQPPTGLPSDTHLDKTPPRRTVGLDLVRNGWTYNCMECHKLFPAKWHYDRPLNEHKDVRLEHGNNRYCLNCHHPTNRNAFVDYDGGEIAQADVVQLCAKCHGTIYRDWQAGVHGRPNGFWNAQMGDKTRLRCIQCHDPHSPRFKAMKPLPPLQYPPRAPHPPPTRSSEEGARLAPAEREVDVAVAWNPRVYLDSSCSLPVLFLYFSCSFGLFSAPGGASIRP